MNDVLKAPLIEYLTGLADDELILGHRLSEWTGHAPILEEDIALSNMALDELGHARFWYELRQELDGSTPDELIFFREAGQYRNSQLVELPRGDWAFTMLRQYLFDSYEYLLLEMLRESDYRPLAERAAKAYKEELYHVRHAHLWVERLALGTAESAARMATALAALWPYAGQLFVAGGGEAQLVKAGLVPSRSALQARWLELVLPHLAEIGLTPAGPLTLPEWDRGQHSKHLAELLGEMQKVARWEPAGDW